MQSKILIVEDSAIATKALCNMFKQMNCQVEETSEGQQAIQLAQENHYDLIFMDIELPDMNGYEVTKKIRAIEDNNKRIPIVALTAHLDEATKIQCINVGMNDVVAKPLAMEQAEEILTALIPSRGASLQIQDLTAKQREKHASLPLFDMDSVLSQLNDASLLPEMITMFTRSIPEIEQKLKTAYESKDWQALQTIARKVKGEASYCGFKRLHQICLDLENAIKTNNSAAYDRLYSWLFQSIQATLEVVQESGLTKE